MGVKNKKIKEPKTSDENKQNHAFDEHEVVQQAVEKIPIKKSKKKQQNEGDIKDPVIDPAGGKKSKKRKQVTVDEVPVESSDGPKNKKKKSKDVQETPTTLSSTSPEKSKKKKKNKKSTLDTPEDNENDSNVNDTATGESPKKSKKKKSSDTPTSNDNEATENQDELDDKKPAYNHADEKKTVFCGNIPNETGVNQTTVKNLFAQYGKVKSIRMRSETGNILFSKKNKKSCSSFNAYIVFETIEEAKNSLQLNGYKLKDNHLRVNMANDKFKAFQSKGSIFVGNLPFDATEKEVHELFESCGKINYVRIIPRKGICYVCFDKGGTALVNALKLNDTEFKGRNLRVTRCESKPKQEKKKLYKRDPKTGRKIKLRVKKSHKLNDELIRGRGKKSINNPIIKKIKDSQKAKFNRYTDNDQVSKKDLFRRGGKFDKDNREMNRNKMKQKKAFYGSKIESNDVGGKRGVKKGKITKVAKDQKIIAKKLKSAAMRVTSK